MKFFNANTCLLAAIGMLSCGEAGIQANISKTVEYTYEISASDANANGGNLNIEEKIDLGTQEFDRFDIAEVVINFVAYEISGLPEDFRSNFSMSLSVSDEEAPPTYLMATPEASNLRNSDETILMYSAINPSQLINLEAVGEVEEIIKRGNDFDMIMSTDFPDLSQDFTMKFYFDVLVKVRE